jgi:hypothetical protein
VWGVLFRAGSGFAFANVASQVRLLLCGLIDALCRLGAKLASNIFLLHEPYELLGLYKPLGVLVIHALFAAKVRFGEGVPRGREQDSKEFLE